MSERPAPQDQGGSAHGHGMARHDHERLVHDHERLVQDHEVLGFVGAAREVSLVYLAGRGVALGVADIAADGDAAGGLAAEGLAAEGLAAGPRTLVLETCDPGAVVAVVEAAVRPRWIWWDRATPDALVTDGVRTATCWEAAAVHRLLVGGRGGAPGHVWAAVHDLTDTPVPGEGQLDLLALDASAGGDPEEPVRADGHLRPEWTAGGWARTPARWGRWAALLLQVSSRQDAALRDLAARGAMRGDPLSTARAESTTGLLCAEMGEQGLPVDRERAERVLTELVGPRPRDAADDARLRRERDETVLRHVHGAGPVDLRHPAQVRGVLANIGLDVPDTRSWRLESLAGRHPLVPALLRWRKSERIATTYGYRWLDEHVTPAGRLRGAWAGDDGAAGRMTAQAGLHNLPAELRSLVSAEPGHVFVRADLGQIEPRVLAGVARDETFARATSAADLYAPVAERLGVERARAKVAVLAALYGQTSGTAGEALKGLQAAYPVALRYLAEAQEAGRAGRPVRTFGGRLVRGWTIDPALGDEQRREQVAARGRFVRNAVVQGAAAEFFKAWAVTVRSGAAPLGAHIVLCLHDELLVHTPERHAGDVASLLPRALEVVGRGWFGPAVRFVADVSIIDDWSQAKG